MQRPGQRGGAAEEFLIEVVADPADGLGHQQCRGNRVHEQRHAGPGPVHPPGTDHRGHHAAPDAQSAVPDRQHPVPVVRDVLRGGQVEVDPAPDDARRDSPQGHVPDQARVAAQGLPAALRDQDRQGDPDHVHQPVEVNVGRAKMKPVHWRARDVKTQRHAPERTVTARGRRPAADYGPQAPGRRGAPVRWRAAQATAPRRASTAPGSPANAIIQCGLTR